MKSSVRLAAIGGITTLATAFLTGTSLAATEQDAPQQPGQVFVQTDAVTGNAITVYDRTAGGTLRAAGAYPPGGWAACWADRWSITWRRRGRWPTTAPAACCTR